MADTDDDTNTDTLEAVFSPFKDIQRKAGAEEKVESFFSSSSSSLSAEGLLKCR